MSKRRVAIGVYERARGVFELVVSLGKGPDGRYRQRTRTFRGTLTEAKKARAHLLAAVDAERARSEPSAMTFGQLLERHIERGVTRGMSPRTVDDYRSLARAHLVPILGEIPIGRLRTIDLDRFYDGLVTSAQLRPASIRKIHNLARGALRQALRWGLVSTNVAVDASPPAIDRPEIRVPSPADVQKLLAEAPEGWAMLVRLAVATGMRRGELVALRWRDVDLDRGTVRVRAGLIVTNRGVVERHTKTNRVRVVSIGSPTRDALREHRERAETRAHVGGVQLADDVFVFTSWRRPGTEPLRPDSVTQMFERLRRKVGLDGYRFHALRHFHATQLIAAGVDVRTVAGRLGHTSPGVTLSVYSAFLPAKDREAAAMIDEIIDG